jgi:predicted metal-dependent hydrolase
MKETILISMIIVFIYIFLVMNRNNLVYVEANSGTKFLVQKDNYKEQKGKLLGDVVERMYKLKNYLVKNKASYPDYEEYWDQLDQNFTESRTVIYETDPTSDLTSYSVNKGEELSVCLRSKKNGKLHDINLLMYVVIHEMAHFACPEIGHGALFKKIFKKMIEEAIKINLYEKVDYSENPVEYCGMILSSSII